MEVAFGWAAAFEAGRFMTPPSLSSVAFGEAGGSALAGRFNPFFGSAFFFSDAFFGLGSIFGFGFGLAAGALSELGAGGAAALSSDN